MIRQTVERGHRVAVTCDAARCLAFVLVKPERPRPTWGEVRNLITATSDWRTCGILDYCPGHGSLAAET